METLGLAVVALAVVLAHPGLLVLYAVREAFGVPLDAGQVWSFGAVTAFCIFAALALFRRSWAAGAAAYLMLALASVALSAVAAFGLHASWPAAMWRLIGPH